MRKFATIPIGNRGENVFAVARSCERIVTLQDGRVTGDVLQ